MNNVKDYIIKYDKDILPNISELWKIKNLYLENFPGEYYNTEEKEKYLKKRSENWKIVKMLENWKVILVIEDINDKILWLLEYEKIPMKWGIYIHLSWLLIDMKARWKWISSILHKEYEKEAKEINLKIEEPSCQSLNVVVNNYVFDIYKKWWYEINEKINWEIHMIKDF